MSCTCTEDWKSVTWTLRGPTPHMKGCKDGEVQAAKAATAAGFYTQTPCPVCGAKDHDVVMFQGMTVTACPKIAKDAVRVAGIKDWIPDPLDDHAALVAYLLSAVRRKDWHAVADAACDLRVLEASRR